MGIVLGGVELYAGPVALGAPEDLDAVIRGFINEAKHSLAIAVQELDSRAIATSIVAAKARGIQVQIILEGGYLLEEPPLADPWAAAGPLEATESSIPLSCGPELTSSLI